MIRKRVYYNAQRNEYRGVLLNEEGVVLYETEYYAKKAWVRRELELVLELPANAWLRGDK